MTAFTPVSALLGGLLIGLSAAILLWANGRMLGVSGIAAALAAAGEGLGWRAAFLFGAIVAPLGFVLAGRAPTITLEPNWAVLAVSGLLVGVGTRLGAGCTSGHGICGLARFSPRSAVAVVTFMLVAALTVFVARHGL
ncbi:MAG: YeeE/YedE family protein [Maricaulaceae bacterium]